MAGTARVGGLPVEFIPVGIWLGLMSCAPGASAVLPPLTDVVQVAAGQSHTCALTEAGAVKCWGRNGDGQLGDGSALDRALPVDVVGLDAGVMAISVGGNHSCALTQAGAVKCWGGNAFGQLGDASTDDRSTPVQVQGLDSGVQAISAGERSFTCALKTGGAVACWGSNDLGSLGNGGISYSSVPVTVSGLAAGVRAISAGNAHACAILASDNALRCWGYNLGGQVGDGTTTSRTTPVSVSGLGSGVAAVDAGVLHTCAVTQSGAAKCWGNNVRGQLGDGTVINRPAPVDVAGLASDVVAVAAGHYHSCARLTGGTVQCWGDNYHGQLGVGVESYGQTTPGPALALGAGATQIAAGRAHACAIVADGALVCWGNNDWGQVGNGSVAAPTFGRAPVDVVGLSGGVAAVVAGAAHTCALTVAGAVKCWGRNVSGQLGDGSQVRRFAPVTVTGLLPGVEMIAAGAEHSCALAAGTVQCWGSNQYNQLGAPGHSSPHPPVSVSLPDSTTTLSAGRLHTCAVNGGGRVSCWGAVPFVGSGGLPGTLADLISGIRSVAAGSDHNCALATDGQVRCWGSSGSGQFGYFGDDSPYQTVVVEDLLSGVQVLSAGRDHTCALTAAGRVQCWGSSLHGQGGAPAPVGFVGLDSGVHSIAAGDYHNCVAIAGAAKCWGNNALGQLGDGSDATSFLPVAVAGLGSGVQSVSAGSVHSCALTAAGGVKCWGDNEFGQMGDGRFPGVALPEAVRVDPAFFRDGFEGMDEAGP